MFDVSRSRFRRFYILQHGRRCAGRAFSGLDCVRGVPIVRQAHAGSSLEDGSNSERFALADQPCPVWGSFHTGSMPGRGTVVNTGATAGHTRRVPATPGEWAAASFPIRRHPMPCPLIACRRVAQTNHMNSLYGRVMAHVRFCLRAYLLATLYRPPSLTRQTQPTRPRHNYVWRCC